MVFDDLIEARSQQWGHVQTADETSSVDALHPTGQDKRPAILPSLDLKLDERLGAFASYLRLADKAPGS